MKNYSLENQLLYPPNLSDYWVMYKIALGSDNEEQAIKFLEDGISNGAGICYYYLGNYYEHKKEYRKAREIYERGAKETNNLSCLEALAEIAFGTYKEKRDFSEDGKRALKRALADVCERGGNDGFSFIGKSCQLGWLGKKEEKEGFNLVKRAGINYDYLNNEGNDTLVNLTYSYLYGVGTEQDVDKAIETALYSGWLKINNELAADIAKTLYPIDPERAKRYAIYSALNESLKGVKQLGKYYFFNIPSNPSYFSFAEFCFNVLIKYDSIDGYMDKALLYLSPEVGKINEEKALNILQEGISNGRINKNKFLSSTKKLSEMYPDNLLIKQFLNENTRKGEN